MNFISRMSVSGKLIFGFATVLTLFLALGLFSINRIAVVNDMSTEIADNWLPSTRYVSDMNTNTSDFRMAELQHILSMTPEEMTKFEEEIANQDAKIRENLKKYEPLATSAEETKLLAEFKSKWDEYTKEHQNVRALSRANKTDEAKTLLRGKSQELFDLACRNLEAIVALNVKGAAAASAEGDAIYSFSRGVIITAVVLGLLIGIVLATYIARSISNPLRQALNSISTGSEQISAAATLMSTASQQVSSGSTEAAASLEETAASVEELTSMVKLNADHAREAGKLSSTSRDVAEQGNRKISDLVKAMDDISHGSKRIEDIITVIDDIAFQTNLLALNAAVEAARAGEQGKGFAVVADAVRALAARSGSAAKDINALIKESVSQAGVGTKLAGESEASLKMIVDTVKRVSDLNTEIATACNEQANGLEQISKAMSQLDQATQTNVASAEETAATSEELSTQAASFLAIVDDLKILVEGASAAERSGATPITALNRENPSPQQTRNAA